MNARPASPHRETLGFYATHWRSLFAYLPLAFVPIYSAAFQTLLVKQHLTGLALRPDEAAREALKLTPSLLRIRGRFALGFLALGHVFGYKQLPCSSMATSVVVFERLAGNAARERCRELIDADEDLTRSRKRSLLALGLLIASIFLWVLAGSLYEPAYAIGFWFFLGLFVLALLTSGTIDAFRYTAIVRDTPGRPDLRQAAEARAAAAARARARAPIS